jgi:hypothetical protein
VGLFLYGVTVLGSELFLNFQQPGTRSVGEGSQSREPPRTILSLNVSVTFAYSDVFVSSPLMSLSINFCGGTLLVMMGQQTRSESLFYYFWIEDHIPDDHLLRLVDRHVDFAFVRETLKASYSHTGGPSIDPEVLLRILLIGYPVLSENSTGMDQL